MSLYADLGVEENASKDEIKSAYREKVKKAHPDAGGDPAEFRKIAKAYAILSDDAKRRYYDQTGETKKPKSQAYEIAIEIYFARVAKNPSNLKEDIRGVIDQNIQKRHEDIGTYKQEITKIEAQLKRIRERPAEDFLQMAADSMITDKQLAIDRAKLQIQDFKTAWELLNAYAFHERPQRAQTMFPGNIVITSASHTWPGSDSTSTG